MTARFDRLPPGHQRPAHHGAGFPHVPLRVRNAFSGGQRFVSQVCAIEIAIKYRVGKLALPPPFETDFAHAFREMTQTLAAHILPIDLRHISALARLPLHHRDPFDRLVIAQALTDDLTIITRDRAFTLYPGLDVYEI